MKFTQSNPGDFPVIVLLHKGEVIMTPKFIEEHYGGLYGPKVDKPKVDKPKEDGVE